MLGRIQCWWHLFRLRSKDFQLRKTAARRLGGCRTSWAASGLMRALGDAEPAVRDAALRSLARIGGTNLLMTALREWSKHISSFAGPWFCDSPPARVLMTAVRDENVEVRRQALRELRPLFENWALWKLDSRGNDQWRDDLLSLAAQDVDAEVRREAQLATYLVERSYYRVTSHPV